MPLQGDRLWRPGREGLQKELAATTPRGLEPRPSSARRAHTSAFCFFRLTFSQIQR